MSHDTQYCFQFCSRLYMFWSGRGLDPGTDVVWGGGFYCLLLHNNVLSLPLLNAWTFWQRLYICRSANSSGLRRYTNTFFEETFSLIIFWPKVKQKGIGNCGINPVLWQQQSLLSFYPLCASFRGLLPICCSLPNSFHKRREVRGFFSLWAKLFGFPALCFYE